MRVQLLVIAELMLVALGFSQTNPSTTFDLILRKGTIIDGTGATPYNSDIAIRNSRIAKIGELSSSRATIELDASGLYVAPGFINIHSHFADSAIATAENMLTQGVTTVILNSDGQGSTDVGQQLTEASKRGLALNIGAYVGFNTVWSTVVGLNERRATGDEIRQMQETVATNLERGAWGVAAGLDYKPAYFATTDEVIRVVEVASKWRTNFPNHDRITPESDYSSRAGITETITIGQRAGLLPVVTHMKVQGLEQGTASEVMDLMNKSTAAGRYTAADAYPYLAGQTGLANLIIPAWAQEGGRAEMLKRFQEPDLRARIIREAEGAMGARFGGAKGVYIPSLKKELVDLMQEGNVSAGEALLRVLEKDNPAAILRFGIESDLIRILRNPATAIACDCDASLNVTHPRGFGTFPRVLGHYVRETNTLTWEDAIRKMTGLPANTIGMVDRGFLVPGMFADVTVFDPKTVIDHATYENPMLVSEGIRHVVINGQLALRDGKTTGVQAGRVLARSQNMPSRKMSTDARRELSVSGSVLNTPMGKVEVTIRMTQDSRTRKPNGEFRLNDTRNGTAFESADLGLLQLSEAWATFSGIVRDRANRQERSVIVIVEQSDPFANQAPTVTVETEGGYHVKGTLEGGKLELRSSSQVLRR